MQRSLLYRFNIYQKERFPLAILVFTTTAVLLSSAAILDYKIDWTQVVAVFFAVLAYLFHMRVIDEVRDFRHDTEHHKIRPIQRGDISIKELKKIDVFGLVLFAVVAFVYGVSSLIVAAVILVYTFIAGNDFFLGEKIRQRFFLYNAINMLQVVLIQLFIYAVFTKSLDVNLAMWLHLFFVLTNSTIIEIVRKIKIKLEESSGLDTYSSQIGFNKSLVFFLLVAIFNYMLFLWLLYSLSFKFMNYFIISAPLALALYASVFAHSKIQTKKSENALLAFTVLFYVGLNLIIYFFRLI